MNPRLTSVLLNLGHSLDHLVLLIFAAAVASIANDLGVDRWEDLMPYGAPAFFFFGFMDAVAIRLQGVQLAGVGEVPVQLIQALPYVMTVVLLAGFIGSAVAPQALGKPYLKER